MTISVQPVDGLINRLLQQNSRSAAVTQRRSDNYTQTTQDQLSISARAQSQSASDTDISHQQSKSGGKMLESHLLNLYKMNDSLGA